MHEGCPCEPLCQLDLDKTCEIAAVNIRSGLLQLFRATDNDTEEEYFLVEMKDGYDLFDLGSCLMELQGLLHCRVDMVVAKSV